MGLISRVSSRTYRFKMGKKPFKVHKTQSQRRRDAAKKRKGLKNFGSKHVKDAWDAKKSMSQNLKDIGLSVDPNKSVPIKTLRQQVAERIEREANDGEVEVLPSGQDAVVAKPEVIEALEKNSKSKSKFKINDDTAQFCIYMIELYGDDYTAMSRDKRNFYQDTGSQIRRKIASFKRTTDQWNEYQQMKEKHGSVYED